MYGSKATQDQIRERLTLSDVIGARVKLKRAGKEYMGLCPFHGEKSPSFTVNNQKGFFHCFGCGAHGDVFGFLMQDGNLSFPEALERAADMAGVKLEKSYQGGASGPSDAQLKHRERLFQVMRRACDFFQDVLNRHEGAQAKHYLESRSVVPKTQLDFGIGYAPAKRDAVLSYLKAQGFSQDEIKEVGLLSENPDTGAVFDKFRDRLVFAITNPKGQVVGFGGRALKKDQAPKYLNSPETPLFHKGSQVYNFDKASKSRNRSEPLLIVEGYMDVVKLAQQGYERVVASLGTALTEGQIQQCWKLDRMPIVMMDGDQAGIRAQKRVIERALPLISAEKTLLFLTLPGGLDPDAYVDEKGVRAFRELLGVKKPLIDQLWALFYLEAPRGTPEERARAEKEIKALVQTIGDQSLRQHYQEEIKQRLFEMFSQRKAQVSKTFQPQQKRGARSMGVQDLTEKILMLLALRFPQLVEESEEEFARLSLNEPYHSLQKEVLDLCAEGALSNSESLSALETQELFSPIFSAMTEQFVRSHVPVLLGSPAEEEIKTLWHKTLGALLKREEQKSVQEAKRIFEANPTEENWASYLSVIHKNKK